MGPMAQFGLRKDEKELIVRDWCVELHAASDSKAFEGDVTGRRFSNPVAYHISQTSQDVVHYLFSEEDDPEVPESLDDLCRLIALQQSRPSDAFASFFQLRNIVFSHVKKDSLNDKVFSRINDRIDACTLRAMDNYMRFREQVMQYRIDELKMALGAFGRSGASRSKMGA